MDRPVFVLRAQGCDDLLMRCMQLLGLLVYRHDLAVHRADKVIYGGHHGAKERLDQLIAGRLAQEFMKFPVILCALDRVRFLTHFARQ